jgi:hypothetical protein
MLGLLLAWAGTGAGGATIDKPVAMRLIGARCSDDGKGSIAAFFGPSPGADAEKLGFNIGPILNVNLPHSRPYAGPGIYTGAQIAGIPVPHDYKTMFTDQGTVVVNADRQSGTFATDDGKAAGKWDCGTPLR